MTNQEIANWIRDWIRNHHDCKELSSMYEDFRRVSSEDIGKLTILILGMDPLKYMSYVPREMFFGCESMTSVVIPNNITSIGSYAFSYCRSLTSITIPDSVKSISNYAFSGCSGLTSIKIPDSVTSIGSFVFEDCTRLTSITIPDRLTSIGWGVFSDCTGLTSITIPNSITSIDTQAFWYCLSLSNIKFNGTVDQWESISIGKDAFMSVPAINITCSDGVTKLRH